MSKKKHNNYTNSTFPILPICILILKPDTRRGFDIGPTILKPMDKMEINPAVSTLTTITEKYILYIYEIYSIYNIYIKEIVMRLIISNSSQEPIYEQISKQIKNLIIRGELSEGEALPSIRGLAQELQISVITTKRAYEELEREGFIETVPGKGSFVSSQNKELLKEKRIKMIEEKMGEIVAEGKSLGISLEELKEMLKLLYEEEV